MPSCITTAISLRSRKALLVYLSLSVVHMRQRDSTICLNLHILSTVWSYVAPDSPSYMHTLQQRELGAENLLSKPFSASTPPSVLSNPQRGAHTYRGNHEWTHTHTHTNTQSWALTLKCIRKTIEERPTTERMCTI